MCNFIGKIECPSCYDFVGFSSNPADTDVMLGDYFESFDTSCLIPFEFYCPSCKRTQKMQAIIKNGQLVKYVPEHVLCEKSSLNKIKNIPNGSYRDFSYSERKSAFLGEDTMFLVDFDGITIDIGWTYPVFDKMWNIERIYKECIDTSLPCDEYERLKKSKEKNFICEVSSYEGLERILVLREGYFPILHELSWKELETKDNVDPWICLSEYILPENNILVICVK